MQPVDLLISPRWTLPIEPEGAVLEGYSTAVHEGRIVEVGPTAALLARYQPAMANPTQNSPPITGPKKGRPGML